jgi:hypothetical protein
VEGRDRPRAIEEARDGGFGRLHSVENASDRAQPIKSRQSRPKLYTTVCCFTGQGRGGRRHWPLVKHAAACIEGNRSHEMEITHLQSNRCLRRL